MYNSERFIEECIDSILNQGIEMKIIVVDDASEDKSTSIVSTYNQIELIKNEVNMGTYYSINVALKKASNDATWTHFTVHGSDDISLTNRFKTQLDQFKNSSKLAIGCRFKRTDYITGRVKPTNPNTNESVLIFDRKIFNELGYYDTNRAACDTEYKKRLLLRFPGSIFNIDKFMIKSYLHNDNLTKKIPVGGTHRKRYVERFTRKHQRMKRDKNFYQDFKP